MKKFDLSNFLDLIRSTNEVINVPKNEPVFKWQLYFLFNKVVGVSKKFFDMHPFFELSKRKYNDLEIKINSFFETNKIIDTNGQANFDTFGEKLPDYYFSHLIVETENAFLLFQEESKDAMVFNIEPISVYDVKKLNSQASDRFYEKSNIPPAALREYDEAGRCLILAQYTACGFHSLRSLEIMIKHYLQSYGKNIENLKSWNDYVKALDDLQEGTFAPDQKRPSKKVSAMIDRLRQIDRNPLMHPEDSLTADSADSLFSLCWITLTEMVRDLCSESKAIAIVGVPGGDNNV